MDRLNKLNIPLPYLTDEHLGWMDGLSGEGRREGEAGQVGLVSAPLVGQKDTRRFPCNFTDLFSL